MTPVRTDKIQIVSSRSGRANLEVDGVPYHSPYDPGAEARKFYAGLALEDADVVIHFGWGLGYAGAALEASVRPDARVIVVEPDEDIFSLYRSGEGTAGGRRAPLEDPRFTFVTGAAVGQFLDAIGGDCQETDKFLWVDWPRAVQMTGDVSARLHAAFDRRLRDRAANLLTHFQNGQLYFENAVANLRYAGDPTVRRLFGQFGNVPLVLVSAGPSLDRNIRELRGMESRCLIVAVDTALRPLLAAGIVPHLVVIADPSELNARHILGALPPATFLVAEQAVHPLAMAEAEKRFQFSVGVFPDGLYAEFGLERSRLDVWGSVATAALDLACKTGANPIIFLGQDCAYSWGRDYARHTIFDTREFDPGRSEGTELDVFGHPVPTTENLVAYRDSMLRRIRAERRTRFINATEGGILHGEPVQVLSLTDALHQACTSRVDPGARIERLHRTQEVTAPMAAHLAEVLEKCSDRCGCRNGFLDLVAKEAVLRGDRRAMDDALRRGSEVLDGKREEAASFRE